MIHIFEDGTVVHDPKSGASSSDGCRRQGKVVASYARLVDVFGPPTSAGDSNYVYQWLLETPAGTATLSDSRVAVDPARHPGANLEWCVGGEIDAVVQHVSRAVRKALPRTRSTLMKQIKEDGTVEDMDAALAPSSAGGGRLTDLHASYNEVVALFGPPTFVGDTDKTHQEWLVGTPDGYAAIYDYKEPGDPADYPDRDIFWSVGGVGHPIGGWVLRAYHVAFPRSDADDPDPEDASAVLTILAARDALVAAAEPPAHFSGGTFVRGRILARHGGQSLDWDLHAALELVKTAAGIKWVRHPEGFDLAVLDADGHLLHFKAPAPARLAAILEPADIPGQAAAQTTPLSADAFPDRPANAIALYVTMAAQSVWVIADGDWLQWECRGCGRHAAFSKTDWLKADKDATDHAAGCRRVPLPGVPTWPKD